MPRYTSSLAKGHRHDLLLDPTHDGWHTTTEANGHTHRVPWFKQQAHDVAEGRRVRVATTRHVDHDHTFLISSERRSNPMDEDISRIQRERGQLEGEARNAAEIAKHRATHPFSFLGRLHEDAMEGLNYVDELDVVATGLDALGLAFAVREFRSQPYAHRYAIHDASSGHDEDWVYDDDVEAWVREGETRAEREAASSDPENRIRKDNPDYEAAPRTRAALEQAGWRRLTSNDVPREVWTDLVAFLRDDDPSLARRRQEIEGLGDYFEGVKGATDIFLLREDDHLAGKVNSVWYKPARLDNPGLAYAPTERFRADGAEDGLFNSDDSLETAIEAWTSPMHNRFEPGPRPEDRKAFVDQLVAEARRDVDVEAVPREYQEIYRKAFGEGFRERLEAWVKRWEKTVADENRGP